MNTINKNPNKTIKKITYNHKIYKKKFIILGWGKEMSVSEVGHACE